MTPKYRPDIDGLRAIAVLSVLFFHSGMSVFSGGYVGVDIFFVISGYLITTIIVREIASNDFSIVRFYERRFRRILPALTVVMAASLIAGFLLLPPDGLIDLGQSAVAAALFSSNILFFIEAEYFGGAAELKPLLHTWSLAIEEQYYIFFPLLLVLIARIDAKNYLRWLVVLGTLSLVSCVVLTGIDASAAFYWIPTRAWELFIGSVLALHVIPVPSKHVFRELNSLLGIGMIVFSVFFYTSETAFPGFAALLPTIGAALVIHSGLGGGTYVYKALSLRPVVFIGLISYSLYLWHWPVIVYTKIWSIKEPSDSVVALMVVAIFVLSVLSWKFIESPFRKKTFVRSRPKLFWVSGFASVVIIVVGLVFALNYGYSLRTTSGVVLVSDEEDYKWRYLRSCEGVIDKLKSGRDLCDIGTRAEKASFILWGDSHAQALASGVSQSAANMGVRGKIAARSACPPLISIERPNRVSCDEFNTAVLEYISAAPEIETVILAARWALSTKGTRYKQEYGNPVRLVDLAVPGKDKSSNVELFEIGLARTIKKLHELGKEVVLVNPVPEVGYDVSYAIVVTNMAGKDINAVVAPTIDEYRKRTEEVGQIFRRLTRRMQIALVAPDAYLCDTGRCIVAIDGVSLYRDGDHLSTYGSEYLSHAFDEVFRGAGMKHPQDARLTMP
jgi:peptidoglycan/LPS O-acetylase OafA/YrhL